MPFSSRQLNHHGECYREQSWRLCHFAIVRFANQCSAFCIDISQSYSIQKRANILMETNIETKLKVSIQVNDRDVDLKMFVGEGGAAHFLCEEDRQNWSDGDDRTAPSPITGARLWIPLLILTRL